MTKAIPYCLIILFWLEAGAMNRASITVAEQDRIRLAEAFRLADAIDGKIWKDWEKAPFAVLLVTFEYEFLIRHPHPSSDFIPLGKDDLLNSDVYYRQRTQPIHFLATFPLLDSIPTIVIGQAENTTAKASTRWILALLHEHFHQLQMSQPDYFNEVEKLDLSGGDQTGMWMLNYSFPYNSPVVQKEFRRLAGLLRDALLVRLKPDVYFKERAILKALLSDKDYKYLSFQLWQEGIARYTEHKIAVWALMHYEPSPAFQSLSDYESFDSLRRKILIESIEKPLESFDLAKNGRESFYAYGAAEGILLDSLNPDWRHLYFEKKFFLENYQHGIRVAH